MRRLEEYAERYENATLHRDDAGVLEVTLHTRGHSLRWSESAHRELPMLFADIAMDPENRTVILTGSGDDFCVDRERSVWADMEVSAFWDKLYVEGKRLLQNLLSIEVPVVTAIHGRAHVHAELAVLGDIVVASPEATIADPEHFQGGVVPGDGVHIIWPMLLGPNQGRYFLLTGEPLTATEALRWGVVQEIVEREQLRARALEIAHDLAAKPVLTLRGTRALLTQELQRRLVNDLGPGLVFEGRAATARATESTQAWTGHEHLSP